MVAHVKANSLYSKNVGAFKAGGQEEVGERRKEERVRSKSKRGVRQGSNQSGDHKPCEHMINKQLG